MGKRFAPSGANIFMAEWEQQVMTKVTYKPDIWFRYLDDIYFLWNYGKEHLEDFFKILNRDHPCVSLKHETSLQSVDFLDVTVYKGNRVTSEGKLETKLYHKPTDTMELLHTESYHPDHTFKGILKFQIMRFHHICSTNTDFEDACTQLFKALVPHGYTSSLLRQIKKDTLQQINNPASKTKGPNKLFMKYLHEPTTEFKVSKCGSRCETCLVMETGSSFTSTNTGKQYPIHYNMTCRTKEIIYLITYKKCKIQYVGQTSRCLRERMWKYRNRITTPHPPQLTEVEAHFRSDNDHDGKIDFSIMPIFQRTNPSMEYVERELGRQQMEDFFINILDTKHPKGLNGIRAHNARVLSLKIMYTKNIHEWSKGMVRHWYHRVHPMFRCQVPGRTLVAVKRRSNLKDLLCRSPLDNPYNDLQIPPCRQGAQSEHSQEQPITTQEVTQKQ